MHSLNSVAGGLVSVRWTIGVGYKFGTDQNTKQQYLMLLLQELVSTDHSAPAASEISLAEIVPTRCDQGGLNSLVVNS